VQRVLRDGRASVVDVLDERDVPLRRDEPDLVQVRVPSGGGSARADRQEGAETHWLKRFESWSLVTLSGRFWMKRILFGGRYSSGICTFGRFVVSAAASPLPACVTRISMGY
jgi:hypothetical protein